MDLPFNMDSNLMFFFLIIFVAGLGALIWVSMSETPSMAAPCKPHVWRYRDGSGWLPQDCVDNKRLDNAHLRCVICNKPPSQDSGSEHGKYDAN